MMSTTASSTTALPFAEGIHLPAADTNFSSRLTLGGYVYGEEHTQTKNHPKTTKERKRPAPRMNGEYKKQGFGHDRDGLLRGLPVRPGKVAAG